MTNVEIRRHLKYNRRDRYTLVLTENICKQTTNNGNCYQNDREIRKWSENGNIIKKWYLRQYVVGSTQKVRKKQEVQDYEETERKMTLRVCAGSVRCRRTLKVGEGETGEKMKQNERIKVRGCASVQRERGEFSAAKFSNPQATTMDLKIERETYWSAD